MSYSLINKLKSSPCKTKVAFKSLLTNNLSTRIQSDMKPPISSRNHESEANQKSWEDFDVSFGSFDEPLHEKVNYQQDDNRIINTTPSKFKTNNSNCIIKKIPSFSSSFSSSLSYHDAQQTTPPNDSWSKFDDGDSADILKSHDQFVKNASKSPVAHRPEQLEMDFEVLSQKSLDKSHLLHIDDFDFIEDLKETSTQSSFKRVMSPEKVKVLMSPPMKRARPIQQIRMFSTDGKNNDKTNDNDKPETSKHHTILLQTQNPISDNTIETKPKSGGFQPTKIVKPLVLSSEQEYILQLVKQGVSLFYTGSAGTGKSVLLRAIIKSLKSQYKKGQVAVTASTGLAACNIGGITLHSFAGVGLGNGTTESLIKKVKRNRKAANRWREVKVLIIDEISMIDGKFFNMLDEIARKLRRSNEPFGGIQVVVCGDFYQLPPVSKSTGPNGSEMHEKIEAMFAFESESWQAAIQKTLVLKEVFRQRGTRNSLIC